jgi:hypothetical protein
VALLANAAVPSTAIVIYLVLATFPHANLRWTFGPLGRVFVSPAYHRIHHAAVGRNDLNLGTVLTLGDVLARRAVSAVGVLLTEAGAIVSLVATASLRRPQER